MNLTENGFLYRDNSIYTNIQATRTKYIVLYECATVCIECMNVMLYLCLLNGTIITKLGSLKICQLQLPDHSRFMC